MTDTVDSVVPVTQEDREAGAALAEWLSEQQRQWQGMAVFFSSTFPSMCREGRFDEHEFIQAFARRLTAERKHEAEVERLREALRPFAFLEMGADEDEGTRYCAQEVWQTIYRDRVQDWFDAVDIQAARQALGESQ